MSVLVTVLAGDAVRNALSWGGWVAVCLVLGVASIAVLVTERDRWRVGRLPYPLLAFLALALLSIAWSNYRGETAIAVLAQTLTSAAAIALALLLDWDELLELLAKVLTAILGLSILFELFTAAVLRGPLLPWWADYGDVEPLPKPLYWSRGELLEGGRIQGIVGNASLLAFLALLALIVLAVKVWRDRRLTVLSATGLVLAALTIALTRSATITVALVAVAVVLVAVLVIRRTPEGRPRAVGYGVLAGLAAAAVAAALVFRGALLEAVGKSEDLTGRLDIWNAVADLAAQHPLAGWGWISYWAPWREPFADLVIKNGVQQLHAHNAWLDVWLQLGALGLIVFSAYVLSTLVRAWTTAIDRRDVAVGSPGRHSPTTVLPLLLLVALLVQSVAESRLLVEYGWLLLTLIAVTTKGGIDPRRSLR